MKIFFVVLMAMILIGTNVFAAQPAIVANWILEPTSDFDIVSPMTESGYTTVIKNGEVGIINSAGNLVFGKSDNSRRTFGGYYKDFEIKSN